MFPSHEGSGALTSKAHQRSTDDAPGLAQWIRLAKKKREKKTKKESRKNEENGGSDTLQQRNLMNVRSLIIVSPLPSVPYAPFLNFGIFWNTWSTEALVAQSIAAIHQNLLMG